MNWLAPNPDIGSLPVLPQVHDGQHQTLLMIAPPTAVQGGLIVLRLWPSNRELLDSGQPLWVGKVDQLYLEQELPLIAYLRTTPDFEAPLGYLQSTLQQGGTTGMVMRTRQQHSPRVKWQGQVLLAWKAGS
jgi:undecaprenyl-diphosphatase